MVLTITPGVVNRNYSRNNNSKHVTPGQNSNSQRTNKQELGFKGMFDFLKLKPPTDQEVNGFIDELIKSKDSDKANESYDFIANIYVSKNRMNGHYKPEHIKRLQEARKQHDEAKKSENNVTKTIDFIIEENEHLLKN